MNTWKPIDTAPEAVEVETTIIDARGQRNTQALTKSGRLWFAGSMYVYYEPTHWRVLGQR